MIKDEPLDILVVDHNSLNAELLNDVYAGQQIIAEFALAKSVPELLDKLDEKSWQQIILIIDNIPVSISALIEAIPGTSKNCSVIVLCQDYQRESALQYMYAGATEVFSLDETAYLARLTKEMISRQAQYNDIQAQLYNLQKSEQRSNALYEQIPLPIAVIHEGAFIDANPAFQQFFNIPNPDEIGEMSFLDFIANKDVDNIKRQLRDISNGNQHKNLTISNIDVKKRDGILCSVNLLVSPTEINNESGLQIIFQSTENHQQPVTRPEDDTAFLSPNEFHQILTLTIRDANQNLAHSLCLFEIDNFSRIKASTGITRANRLLHEISLYMEKQATTSLKISPFNSDVYTLLVSAESKEDCVHSVKHLQADFNNYAFSEIKQNIKLSSNIGLVHITDQLRTAEQALSLADVACTVSRNKKQSTLHIYNQEDDRSTIEHADQDWVDKIQDALKFDNFKLLFQPIVSLGADQEKYYEVLLRIKSSDGDDKLPNQFLRFARKSNLESKIDKWVIKRVVDILEENQQEPICFFINLSESSLKDIDFIHWLLENYSSQIMNLVFEIPEDIAIKWQSETLHFIQQISAHSGSICIDRYSNLPNGKSQLSALNADFFKIDGELISNLSTNRKHQSIIHTICQDTRQTDTKLIASYVQDADSLAILWRENVDFIQGNYLQAPASHLDYKFEGQI